MEIIKLPRGGIKKLATDFKVCTKTAEQALRGEKSNPLAKVLRKAALERGGIRYAPVEQITKHNNTVEMKATYFKVSYTKATGQASSLVVKARNEAEALRNARNECYTGKNFHSPVEVEKQSTFAQDKARTARRY